MSAPAVRQQTPLEEVFGRRKPQSPESQQQAWVLMLGCGLFGLVGGAVLGYAIDDGSMAVGLGLLGCAMCSGLGFFALEDE